MDPVEEQLELLRQNPGNWTARAELAHLWRERGVHFEDKQLLAGAGGAPHNRAQLQHLLDALEGPPTIPAWAPVLDEYLRWSPGCPLGLSPLAHVVEAIGKTEEALELYEGAVKIDPSVAEPLLQCLRKDEAKPRPAEEDPSEKKLMEDTRFVSLLTAVIVHLVLIVLLSLWVINAPPLGLPRIVASAPPEDIVDTPRAVPRRSQLTPITSKNAMEIASTPVSAEVSMPLRAPTPPTSPSLLGGSTFGPSMSFGDNSGGSVSFFGSKGKTKNMVYVVDVSGSMQQTGDEGKSRAKLMKEELKRSVSALPYTVRFQIIFFNNSAWFAGQQPGDNGFLQADKPESLPTKSLIRATRSEIRKTLVHVDEVRIGGGTNWRLPLKMALNLKPDLIYFMTDGEIDTDRGDVPIIDDVVDYNRKKGKARINTICLMELQAYDKLQELARRTQGTVFLVKEDGTVLRGLQLDGIR